MIELVDATLLVSILAAMVRIATPLLLAALGELVAERAGVLNLGVEGTMLTGAFAGFLAAWLTGSAAVGVLAAASAGVALALVMAFLAATLKVEQIVAGLALNLLASGATLYCYKIVFADRTASFPTIRMLEVWPIPGLAALPWVGEILFSQRPLTYLAFLMVPVVWFFLYRSRYGLELRCLGENPKVLDMKGLGVAARQYAAVAFGGLMSGLAGAFITLGSTVRFVPEMSAGRGWLAIVIVIAGNWRPGGVLLAALAFALLEAVQLHLQGLGAPLPHQLLLALPYAAAILAVTVWRARSEEPAHLGRPYRRDG
jgi:simple sugar transport system permease protein